MKQEIEQIKTADLVPYARNAKKHDEAQVAKLAGSIREFGFNNPVLIDADNGIIAGHGRVMAAQKLALASVPCLRLSHLSETQKRAYILADNRLAELGGGWDAEMLKLELADLGDLDVDLGGIGFGADDLQDLELSEEPEASDVDAEPQIDKAEELRAKWGVEPGQLWELGDHRLLCGDSTKAEDVKKLMEGEKAAAAVTDPPFAIMGSSTGAKNDASLIRPFFRIFWQAIEASGANDVYMFCDWRSFPTIHQEAKAYDIKDVIVWDKQSGGLGNPYRRRHEFIVFARPAASDKVMFKKTTSCRSITDDDVWPQARVTEKEHNAQKPIPIVGRCIENSTDAGELVFEPCSGSGTTLIACEQLGRKCRAIEISPAYVAVALQRWADATGKTPKLVA
jgi:DNA modification methylase